MTRTGATAAAAGIALLTAACSGSGSAAATGSKTYQKSLAYAQCMRTHGEPGWPAPSSTGTFSISGIDIGSALFFSATTACQSLLPASAQFQLSAAQQQSMLNHALQMAACMHAHGLPNWPEPSPRDIVTSGGQIGLRMSLAGTGITRSELGSPQVQAALKTCQALTNKDGGGS